MKKTKYQQIAEILDKEGYISDCQIFKIYGDENGLYKSQEHIRIWKKLQRDRNFFADKRILGKKKGYRCHLVWIEGQEKGQYYKVGKEFFNSIVIWEDVKRGTGLTFREFVHNEHDDDTPR